MIHPRLVLLSAVLVALPLVAQVKLTPTEGKVSVEIDGKPFTDFYMSGEAFNAKVTKPYLWPLRAATGTYITRAWPMEDVAEEAAEKKPQRNGPPAMDHQHQRGLWFAHDNVNKLDFWNNEWSYFADLHRKNLGRINLKTVGAVKSGKTQGSIAATFEWTDMEGNNPILTESRVMTFYSDPKLRYFDVDITLTAQHPRHLRRWQGRRLRHTPPPHPAGGQGRLPHHQRRWTRRRKGTLGQALRLVRLFRRNQRREGRRRHPRPPR